jgi:threonine dehydratase
MSRISLDAIREAAHAIAPVFRDSPQIESEPLATAVGARLLLKVETLNPIRSFKGRGAEWFVHTLPPDAPALVCASAGNFGQGMAWAARRHGRTLDVFAATNANPLKVERMRALGATVHLAGDDFDGAKEAGREYATARGAWFVEDGREPPISEGAGTIALELLEAGPFDAVLVPLGNGALLGGMATWIRAHAPGTQVVGVCAAGAPSMERSWRARQVVTTEAASTIADGIAVRVPIPEAVDDLQPLVDDVLLVEDRTTLRAMRLLQQHVGLVVEPAGAVGVAALTVHRDRFAGQRVATVLCGGNVTDQQFRQWFCADVLE